MTKPVKVLQTHDGLFHADEVFACALIKLIYPDVKIIRSRVMNPEADIYVDVGGHFDNHTYFDHHQRGFDEYHINTEIPKSSFGLVYDKYINKLINGEKVINTVKNQIVIPIDAHDNNIKIEKPYRPYTVSNIISAFNAKDVRNNNDEFDTAVSIAALILENCIQNVVDFYYIDSAVIDAFDSAENENRKYAILDKFYQYNAIFYDDQNKYQNIHHVIYKEADHYRALCINDPKTNKPKSPFPKEWGGLEKSQLEEQSGIPGSIFCHRGQFLASNSSLDGMIQMVERCYQ